MQFGSVAMHGGPGYRSAKLLCISLVTMMKQGVHLVQISISINDKPENLGGSPITHISNQNALALL